MSSPVLFALLLSTSPANGEAEHWRIEVLGAPVHVYRPNGFDPKDGGVVLYAHGYFDDLDTVWEKHRLARQFAESERNAIFIATESPLGDDDKVVHRHLGWILHEVKKQLPVGELKGPKIAVGHSGGFRTILAWIERHPIDEIILLDGLYQQENEWKSWLAQNKSRRLTLASIDTAMRTKIFLDKLPAKLRARVAAMQPETDHMGIIEEGWVMPELLRSTRLEPLETKVSSN